MSSESLPQPLTLLSLDCGSVLLLLLLSSTPVLLLEVAIAVAITVA